MSSVDSFPCPLCSYQMQAFDVECPRCHNRGLPAAPAPNVETLSSTKPPLSSTKAKRVIWPLYVLSALLILGVLGYRHWTSTPQFALLQARNAFRAHDLARFERYVSVEKCADSLVDEVFDESMREAKAKMSTNDVFEAAGQKMAEKFMDALKPALSKVLKDKTRELVSTGQISPLGGASNRVLPFDEIQADWEKKGVKYGGIESVEVQGDDAKVTLILQNTSAQSAPLELGMKWFDGNWRVERVGATKFLKSLQ